MQSHLSMVGIAVVQALQARHGYMIKHSPIPSSLTGAPEGNLFTDTGWFLVTCTITVLKDTSKSKMDNAKKLMFVVFERPILQYTLMLAVLVKTPTTPMRIPRT